MDGEGEGYCSCINSGQGTARRKEKEGHTEGGLSKRGGRDRNREEAMPIVLPPVAANPAPLRMRANNRNS